MTGLGEAAELNGKIGMVIAAAENEETGRCVVKLLRGKKELRIKVKNLKVIGEAEVEASLGQVAPSQQGG